MNSEPRANLANLLSVTWVYVQIRNEANDDMTSNFSFPTLLASRPSNPCASNPTTVKLPKRTLVLLDYWSPVLVMRFDLLEIMTHG